MVAFSASALVALALLLRTRRGTVPKYLGLALLAFALGGPAVWPWYLCWALAMLAVWPRAQVSRALVATILVASFLVKPDGILALPLDSSPVVAALWIAAAVLAWYTWLRRGASARGAWRADRFGAARSIVAEP